MKNQEAHQIAKKRAEAKIGFLNFLTFIHLKQEV
jgi:hypothetical protein